MENPITRRTAITLGATAVLSGLVSAAATTPQKTAGRGMSVATDRKVGVDVTKTSLAPYTKLTSNFATAHPEIAGALKDLRGPSPSLNDEVLNVLLVVWAKVQSNLNPAASNGYFQFSPDSLGAQRMHDFKMRGMRYPELTAAADLLAEVFLFARNGPNLRWIMAATQSDQPALDQYVQAFETLLGAGHVEGELLMELEQMPKRRFSRSVDIDGSIGFA